MMAAIPFPNTRSTTMSKKISKTKTTKAVNVSMAKTAEAKPTVTSECPKGGEHEWTDEDGEQFCGKCKEPKAKSKGTKKKPAKEPKEKKLFAIDAAAQVLAASKEPMNAKEMIEAMTAKSLWSSPGGKTPHATLYSAIIREIGAKGKESRFVKTERGKFGAK
jgi:hypothetical protein